MRYNAFISYSHSADSKLAPAIQEGLQKLAKTWYKLSALKIFRDETNLSATPHLWSKIEESLSESDFFILLASPEASKSKWVKKEINYWLENKNIDNLIICITEGNIKWKESDCDFDWECTNSLPVDIKKFLKEEPFIVNLTPYKTHPDLSLQNPDFRQKIGQISATIHGKSLSEIIGKDFENHKKVKRIIITTIMALLFLLVLVTLFYFNSLSNERKAIEQKNLVLKKNKELLANDLATKSQNELKEGNRNNAYRIAQFALNFIDPTNKKSFQALYDSYYFYQKLRTVNKNEDLSDHDNFGKSLYKGSMLKIKSNGSDSDIRCLNFSNDGKKLFIGSGDVIKIIDVKTGQTLLSKKLNSSPFSFNYFDEITGIAISEDDSKIAVSTKDHFNPVYILDAKTCNLIKKILIHDEKKSYYLPKANCIYFSQDSKYLLAGMDDNSIFIWQAMDYSYYGKIESEFKTQSSFTSDGNSGINALAFSPDGKYFVAASSDNSTYVIDAISFNNIKTLPGHEAPLKGITTVAYSPTGEYFATAGRDNTIRLWDGHTFEPILETVIGSREDIFFGIHSISFSKDGKYIASLSSGIVLNIFSIEKNDFVLTYDEGKGFEMITKNSGVKFSNSNYLAFITPDSCANLIYFDGSYSPIVKFVNTTYDTLKVINYQDIDKFELVNSLYSVGIDALSIIQTIEINPLSYSNVSLNIIRYDILNQVSYLANEFLYKARLSTNNDLKKYRYNEALTFIKWLRKKDNGNLFYKDEEVQKIIDETQKLLNN